MGMGGCKQFHQRRNLVLRLGYSWRARPSLYRTITISNSDVDFFFSLQKMGVKMFISFLRLVRLFCGLIVAFYFLPLLANLISYLAVLDGKDILNIPKEQ